jgi:hypothetical protein
MYIVDKMFRCKMLKKHVILLTLLLALSSFAGFTSCAQMDDVSDQSPVLIVHIIIDPAAAATIIPSATNKVYLIYYFDSTWLTPWLQHGSSTDTIINPSVGTFSTYVAAFWDQNGNTVLDAGEPCTGYVSANHSAADPLTALEFYPLEWKEISITLDLIKTY